MPMHIMHIYHPCPSCFVIDLSGDSVFSQMFQSKNTYSVPDQHIINAHAMLVFGGQTLDRTLVWTADLDEFFVPRASLSQS